MKKSDKIPVFYHAAPHLHAPETHFKNNFFLLILLVPLFIYTNVILDSHRLIMSLSLLGGFLAAVLISLLALRKPLDFSLFNSTLLLTVILPDNRAVIIYGFACFTAILISTLIWGGITASPFSVVPVAVALFFPGWSYQLAESSQPAFNFFWLENLIPPTQNSSLNNFLGYNAGTAADAAIPLILLLALVNLAFNKMVRRQSILIFLLVSIFCHMLMTFISQQQWIFPIRLFTDSNFILGSFFILGNAQNLPVTKRSQALYVSLIALFTLGLHQTLLGSWSLYFSILWGSFFIPAINNQARRRLFQKKELKSV